MNDFVQCEICKKKMKIVNNFHLSIHKISHKEYKELYPNSKLISEDAKENFRDSTIGQKRPSHSKMMTGAGNPMFGKKRTKEELEKMSANRKGKGIGIAGKYVRTKEIREKLSNSVSLLQMSGNVKPFYSYYNSEYYTSDKMNRTYYAKSSWELFVMNYLDKHNNIEKWYYEKLRINYIDENGDKRYYIPDFLIKWDCGIWELWEVKPLYKFKTSPRERCKIKALNDYTSSDNEYNVHNGFIITDKVLEFMKTYDFISAIPNKYCPEELSEAMKEFDYE
jgi:hypothetical protein